MSARELFKKKIRSIITNNHALSKYWLSHKINRNDVIFQQAMDTYYHTLQNEEDDCISAIQSFAKVLYDHNASLEYRSDQNDFYGHAKMILHYANLEKSFSPYDMPTIEHGLHLTGLTDINHIPSRCSIMTFGDFRKKTLYQYSTDPVFCIGPLIHYTKSYYNANKLSQIKHQYKRNLLVMPMHFYEWYQGAFDLDEFIAVINKKAREFDSVSVCLYWFDALNQPLLARFKAEGYFIVSAGYRLDQNFLARLRSWIELSDAVITNSVGSHIGYCKYLKKPITFYNQKVEIKHFTDNDHDLIFDQNVEIISQAFENNQSKGQENIYEYYWGEKYVKSSEEIAMILQINQMIIQKSYGLHAKYYAEALRLQKELAHGSASEQKMASLLLDALPKLID